jgi:His/Glu/Gln/Arg/opine family amino acid ABC transporter permease subunit
MGFDINILVEHWRVLANGALLTIVVSAVGALCGLLVAVPIAIARMARSPIVRFGVLLFVEGLRNVPFLVVVYLVHFGLPFLGPRMPAVVSGIVALTLYGAAYYSEVIRASILAVPRGQLESARVVGMSYIRGLWEVVLPQMLRSFVPPATNITLLLLKESSVLSTITVPEMTYAALTVQGQTFSPVEVFVAIGVTYWILTSAITSAARFYERHAEHRRPVQRSRSRVAAQYLSLDWRGSQ